MFKTMLSTYRQKINNGSAINKYSYIYLFVELNCGFVSMQNISGNIELLLRSLYSTDINLNAL